MDGDVSIQYQTCRDLLDTPLDVVETLRYQIATEGWGKRFLQERDDITCLWGNGSYSPKWISTHYTLLDLKNIGLDPRCPAFAQSIQVLLDKIWVDGGIVSKHDRQDLCVSAMALGMCCYCNVQSDKLGEIVDYILEKQYPDGGWNCSWDHGDLHSSLHSTLSVLEALRDCLNNGYDYRSDEIVRRIPAAQEFILRKRLFRSEHSGEVIDHKMLMLSYPCRWKYDILRCMDYFTSVQMGYDDRMEEALELILRKMRAGNRWPVQQRYVGKTHFDMEQTGSDSRWNTLRVLRVLKFYQPALYLEFIK
jgi:hypothetical protein